MRNLGKDDYCMLGALVFTLGYLAAILVLRENGMGYSGTVLTQQQMTTTLQTIVAVEVLYYCCVNSIKVSIVFVYLRIGTLIRFQHIEPMNLICTKQQQGPSKTSANPQSSSSPSSGQSASPSSLRNASLCTKPGTSLEACQEHVSTQLLSFTVSPLLFLTSPIPSVTLPISFTLRFIANDK